MKQETYKAATARLMQELQSQGWTLSNPRLLVPHATSRDGKTRIWFQSQATYASFGGLHNLSQARSLHVDRRGLPASRLLFGEPEYLGVSPRGQGEGGEPISAGSLYALVEEQDALLELP